MKLQKLTHFLNTGSNIDNTKTNSTDQKSLSKVFHCPDCNKELTPDHKDLLDCLYKLMAAKESTIVNDKLVITVKNNHPL